MLSSRQGKYDCWYAGLQRSVASNISTDRKADFKKGLQFRFGGCYQDFEILRFPSGVVEAWLIRIRILIQI